MTRSTLVIACFFSELYATLKTQHLPCKLNVNRYVMSINFENDPNLGKVVSNVIPFCKLTQKMPVPSYEYVVGDFYDPNMFGLAGHKWSRLFGFTFTSTIFAKNPKFQFVYVPKLAGPRYRASNGLHGWYCWQYIANDNRMVTSIDDMMNKYKFDINKFVFSDIFEKYVPVFVNNVRYALSHQLAQLLANTIDQEKHKLLERTINAIAKSLETVYQVQSIVQSGEKTIKKDDNGKELPDISVSPKVGHAKIAYNADGTYRLKNLDKERQERARRLAAENPQIDIQANKQYDK